MTERFKPFTAVLLVIQRDDEVLLQRREGTSWMSGQFSLPSGHPEDSERMKQAIAREGLEEIDIIVEEEDLKLLHTMHAIGPGDDKQFVNLFFGARQWKGEPRIAEPDKSDDLIWAKLTELPENTIASVRQALAEIQKNEPYSEFGWDQNEKTG